MSDTDTFPTEADSVRGPLPFELQADMGEVARRLRSDASLDILFLVFLLKYARFGFFTFGPITIDVRLVEDLVERTTVKGIKDLPDYSDDYVEFSGVLMDEVRRSGRRRIDELHYLLAFMRCGQGIPARVFAELGVSTPAVEEWVRRTAEGDDAPLEQLYSPEDAAEYLGVHVQTVRGWIRSGRLRASRLAGQRALRIRASDLLEVLEPVGPGDVD